MDPPRISSLQLPYLRELASRSRPSFLKPSEFLPGKALPGMHTTEPDGCVCWISAAGCLTPLHYDLNDGLLAQVIGTL